MKIAIIGATGDMGYGLALRLAIAGHDIIIGSRQLEKAENAAEKVKEKAHDIKEDVKRGVDEAKVKAHIAKENIKNKAGEIKEKVAEKIEEEKAKHKKTA